MDDIGGKMSNDDKPEDFDDLFDSDEIEDSEEDDEVIGSSENEDLSSYEFDDADLEYSMLVEDAVGSSPSKDISPVESEDDESEEDLLEDDSDLTDEEIVEESKDELKTPVQEKDPQAEKIKLQNAFRANIKGVLDNFEGKDVIAYLRKFKEDSNYSDIINDIYSSEMMKFADAIDFIHDDEARSGLWIITAGAFADLIEREKTTGKLETKIRVYNRGITPNETIIDDEVILETKARQKKMSDRYEKYRIDRTIFEIADEDNNTDMSIFDDKKSVEKEFFDGPFYPMLKELMTSDRFCNMDNIKTKLIINPDSSWIPIIDFSNGYRIICIDTSDINQYRMHPMMISRKVQFSFPIRERIRTRMVYSDNLIQTLDATVNMLKKTIGFENWNEKHIITLNRNYAIAYTTETRFCDLFEFGDPDARESGNSTYSRTKPFTNVVGVVALDKKTMRDRESARRNQVRYDMSPNSTKPNIEDYDINFVISARYIKNDRALVDPTRTPEERYVRYIVTQYTECKPVIIMDGLQTICSCILREHWINYGKGTRFSIEFEIDRDNLPSPGIMDLVYSNDGVEMSTYKNVGDMSIQTSYCLPPSRLGSTGTLPMEKGRIDRRFFSAGTIQNLYAHERDLYQRYDLGTRDGINEFLRSRGFEEFWSPASITYDVMPYVLDQLATSTMIQSLHKVSLASFADRDSPDRENLLYEQDKIEFFKKLDNSGSSEFQKFLFSVLDWFIDDPAGNKN